MTTGPIESANGVSSSRTQKRPFHSATGAQHKKRKVDRSKATASSHDAVLLADVRALLESLELEPNKVPEEDSTAAPPEPFSEIEVTIESLSSTGDGLGRLDAQPNRVFVVPFSVPGDKVRAKVIRNEQAAPITHTDFLEVIQASLDRDQSLVNCKYFTTCSGCQFQMLAYKYQLEHKRNIVQKAYRNFSGLDAQLVPEVKETMGSPLQYAYRTKLTPHFDGPPGGRRARRHGEIVSFDEVPPIGFMKKGTRKTIDIEDCPIGTPAVRLGLRNERLRVAKELAKYRRGATLLLRESTERIEVTDGKEVSTLEDANSYSVYEQRDGYVEKKTCTTDHNGTTKEYIGEYVFTNPAGAFFQNNNSILPSFTEYIRSVILPGAKGEARNGGQSSITNLIDAYSGSGLFTITLSSLFKRSIGIDIAASSIACATRNAELNKLPSSQVKFIAADATALFASVAADPTFLPENTVVVIDPPRKGCDEQFLQQLRDFGPERIVYVSCNVHTQARDIGWLIQNAGSHGQGEGKKEQVRVTGYTIESLRGFDFFPQTSHVESVAVLQKKSSP